MVFFYVKASPAAVRGTIYPAFDGSNLKLVHACLTAQAGIAILMIVRQAGITRLSGGRRACPAFDGDLHEILFLNDIDKYG